MGDQEVVCVACGESFGDKATLRQHREQIHGAGSEAGIAQDSDASGGTTTPTAGGASRVQTE